MRSAAIAATILALLALAFVSAQAADAGGSKTVKPSQSRAPAATTGAQSRNPKAANGSDGYYEQIEGSVPFGSKRWWDIYSSRPRGGSNLTGPAGCSCNRTAAVHLQHPELAGCALCWLRLTHSLQVQRARCACRPLLPHQHCAASLAQQRAMPREQ